MTATKKLDPAFKAKWVAALRSGEFKQHRGSFTDGQAFCCLGVAAVLCGVSPVHMNGGCFTVTSPQTNRYKLETDATAGHRLAARNDGHDYPPHSFAEMADYIEKNL